tara:strand:+ start:2321 stop:2473 length:153 start_codon:yes stop_codon:yes gene_type:complete
MTNDEAKLYLENALSGFNQKRQSTVFSDEHRTKMEIKVTPKVTIKIIKYK